MQGSGRFIADLQRVLAALSLSLSIKGAAHTEIARQFEVQVSGFSVQGSGPRVEG